MLPLDELEVMLESGVSEDAAMNIIKENAVDGKLFRQAAQEGHVNVVKFLLAARGRSGLKSKEKLKCTNRGAVDFIRTTPLHLAAAGGHLAVVKAIVPTVRFLNPVNLTKDTPLTLACLHNHENIVKILVRDKAWREDTKAKSALKIAIQYNKPSIVKALLVAGARTHQALYIAAEYGREDIVLLLLKNIRDINSSSLNRMAFCKAAAMGHLGVCQILFKAGLCTLEGEIEEKPLHQAAKRGSLEIVRLLLTFGVNKELVDNMEQTPMHIAAKAGHFEIVRILFFCGANIEAQDQRNRTPLYYASFQGHFEIVQFLLMNSAKADVIDSKFSSPLDAAIEMGHRSVALLLFTHKSPLNKMYLLESAIRNGRTLAFFSLVETDVKLYSIQDHSPLHIASKYNRVDYAKILLEKGASVNAQNKRGDTALHCACMLQDGKDMILLLLKRGASVNVTNSCQQIPVALAKNFSVQKFIIENCGDVHIPDAYGCTLLHWANNVKIVKLLLQYNVLIDARDMEGRTPLFYACEGGKVAITQLLIKHGAEVNAKSKNGRFPLWCAIEARHVSVIKVLLKNKADVNVFSDGITPLHYCCRYDDPEIVGLLLEFNADVNVKGWNSWTPLHETALYGSQETACLLIKHGAEVNAINSRGETPLHFAVDQGSVGIVRQLLEKGSDMAIKDENGKTPLERAIEFHASEVEAILKRHISRDNV